MAPEQRIAELEAKLTALQSEEQGGRDPEVLAKAKNNARMSYIDIQWAFEYFGLGEQFGEADFIDLQKALIDRKYDQLSGANKTALSWRM